MDKNITAGGHHSSYDLASFTEGKADAMKRGGEEGVRDVITGNTMSQTAIDTPDLQNATQSQFASFHHNEGAAVSELVYARTKIAVLERIAEEQARELVRMRAEME